MSANDKYWFPAKTYGWGWGLPSMWQGWVVLVVFVLLLAGGGIFLLPLGTDNFIAYSGLLSAIFVAVCWRKGEPPHWRWGNE